MGNVNVLVKHSIAERDAQSCSSRKTQALLHTHICLKNFGQVKSSFGFFDHRWPILVECCIQAVHFLAIEDRIERLAKGEQLIVDES